MNTQTLEKPAIDLSQATPEQLKEALAKLEAKKDKDRESYKSLVAETVPKAMFRLCAASEVISNAKTETFQFFENILDLKNQVYGLKEKQQSHTFSTDKEEITIGYRINDGWDDTVTAGIEKVQNYITSLATNDETAALVKIVFNLLKKDAKGNLKGSRVLELQKLTKDFDSEEFTDGVAIIAAAYKPVRSSWFIEASIINEDGTKTNVPLSMSSVGFSGAYKFDFFSETIQKPDASE
ncbi:DUF3164 family protein [Flavobacterium gilvum]|uniref:DUF3164 family protein n=1 Tax=Flavobacterium gilvum TaxID=1492737 RepID=A0AAC9I4I7_9FLAO|nr:DUF3164 family protein [Flavobacterium gilvum]AOW08718.1 hypothetical protein EM308_03950 [Flavobacterium gilvum]KFC59845.1 hypothetical protein FEM08_13560 [Flavobacterium gilvum]